MKGIVNVDVFVVGGYEEGKPVRSYNSLNKKAVCAVELTDDGKLKHFTPFKFLIIQLNLCVKCSINTLIKKQKQLPINGKATIQLLKIIILHKY
jgi:hypothetical protein